LHDPFHFANGTVTTRKQLYDSLMSDQPSSAFAQILTSTALPNIVTPVGTVPKGSVLSYQTLELEQPKLVGKVPKDVAQDFPPLPSGQCSMYLKYQQKAVLV